MNETIRTVIYVGAGALAALLAFVTRPGLNDVDSGNSQIEKAVGALIGKPIFPKFTDPVAAKSLKITRMDEATAKKKTFEVVEQANGVWTIPSHGGYPADAADQLKSASEALAELKAIDWASMRAADHELYGVLDPSTAEVGAKGTGTLITLSDGKGDELVNLIVGKAVAGATNQHFARKVNEEVVLVTAIDLGKLDTSFEKWIEKDLLKISTFDVAKVSLKDYAILPTEQGLALSNRMEARLNYDNSKGEWNLDQMLVSSRDGQKPVQLGEQEELNKQKLDDLRNGLGDLKIVDVKRKPGGLGNSLRVSADQISAADRQNLQRYGFFAQPAPDGSLDIFGANGEVVVETKDGVQYFLRFGSVADDVETVSSAKPADAGKTEDEKLKIHRYLFVTTQVAPSVLVLPKLEDEPAGPAAEPPKPADAGKTEAGKADAAKTDDKTGETKPPVIDPKQAEIERIKRENKRKMDEYNDKKKKAEVRVKELNGRFADWYYVVSEDVYKKIRLVRSDIVKESAAAKDEGFGPDAFRSLEQGGVKGASKPAAPSSRAFPPMP